MEHRHQRLTPICRALALALALGVLLLAACRHEQSAVGLPGAAVQDCPGLAGLLQHAVERPPGRQMPQERFERAGWQGGRERDGKPGSGVAVYYRFESSTGRAGETVQFKLALGDVHRAPALVTVYGIDGTRLRAGDEHSFWRLQPGVINEIALAAIFPESGGGLVAASCQDGKVSTRHMALPGRAQSHQAPSGDYELDASGNPIVNMQAPLAGRASRP